MKNRVQDELNTNGFSLIEVVVAMGVLSVCLISMVGLFASGLANLHYSTQSSFTGRIADQILVDLEQSTFTDLTTSPPPVTYYDGDGNPLATSANAVYQATYTVSTPAQLPTAVATASLAKITVVVSLQANNSSNATYIGYVAQ